MMSRTSRLRGLAKLVLLGGKQLVRAPMFGIHTANPVTPCSTPKHPFEIPDDEPYHPFSSTKKPAATPKGTRDPFTTAKKADTASSNFFTIPTDPAFTFRTPQPYSFTPRPSPIAQAAAVPPSAANIHRRVPLPKPKLDEIPESMFKTSDKAGKIKRATGSWPTPKAYVRYCILPLFRPKLTFLSDADLCYYPTFGSGAPAHNAAKAVEEAWEYKWPCVRCEASGKSHMLVSLGSLAWYSGPQALHSRKADLDRPTQLINDHFSRAWKPCVSAV
jgi:hypothetical protein